MLSFQQFIDEGVNDPAIFKAIFLAGGPGSGKSFIVGKTGLTSMGYKVVNSDDAFEVSLKKAGMTMNPDDIFSVKGQEIRGKAKRLTAKKQEQLPERSIRNSSRWYWKRLSKNIETSSVSSGIGL